MLATELYKVHHGNIKSVYYDSETISFQAPKIWKLLPITIKDSENLNEV